MDNILLLKRNIRNWLARVGKCRKDRNPIVVLESPFAGDVERNRAYAVDCLRDSLLRGETPFASHLLYTEALDDTDATERSIGIEAGLNIGKVADKTVVYTDLGISNGMEYGIARAISENREIEYRSIYGNEHD